MRPPRAAGKNGAAAADLVARLARGRDLRAITTWPGGGLALELQILTRAETADAHAAALAACAARGITETANTPRAIEARADEEMTQILARAIRDPATHAPLFASAEELASVATDDELVALFNSYADHRHAVDPEPAELSEEVVAEIDAALGKADGTRLSAIVSSMPRHWLRSTALRLATSLRSSSTSTSGSSTSQPNDPPAG